MILFKSETASAKAPAETEAKVQPKPKAKLVAAKPTQPKVASKKAKEETKKVTINSVALKKVPFEELPGWNETDIKNSLLAFQNSCKIFLKQAPSHRVGSRYINLQAKDWQPACKEAAAMDSVSDTAARDFFRKWFHPVEFTQRKPIRGLFTGYYMPQLKGSLTRTKEYNTPIYSMPDDLQWNSGRRGYYTREQIDNGVLKKKASVIAWINSPVERLFLEIEGAGVIQLPGGEKLYLGYAGENGAPYTSVSGVLINKGIMNRDNASKRAVKRYLKNHPQSARSILHRNKSFVFFQDLKEKKALGAQGMALTPGYSLAIDRKWIPLGSPLWLATKKPLQQSEKVKKFHRLVIAQDTGGAIRGLMRGDIYWGSGKRAAYLGEHMKNSGRFWLLLPKHIFEKLIKMA
ncbi:murein transglycosylase A [Legionella massiliensis]|uniref:murein transglycosylase A n=1 Tax=Legionella massiliensis TaxID=1034943 RepID=UPI000ADD9803|nr:MltA domain-containing protein [Legionella massiliensis]